MSQVEKAGSKTNDRQNKIGRTADHIVLLLEKQLETGKDRAEFIFEKAPRGLSIKKFVDRLSAAVLETAGVDWEFNLADSEDRGKMDVQFSGYGNKPSRVWAQPVLIFTLRPSAEIFEFPPVEQSPPHPTDRPLAA